MNHYTLQDIMDGRFSLRFLDIDWLEVGKKVMDELEPHEKRPFIKWLENNPSMLDLYGEFPAKALREWKDSAECWSLKDEEAEGS